MDGTEAVQSAGDEIERETDTPIRTVLAWHSRQDARGTAVSAAGSFAGKNSETESQFLVFKLFDQESRQWQGYG